MPAASICLLGVLLSPRAQVGLATVFGQPGDRWDGGPPVCKLQLRPREFREALPYAVAHRTLPCGTRVRIYDLQSGRNTLGVVLDRGPYGALHQGRWVLKRSRQDPGRWRGILDMTPPVARRLRATGLDPVIVRVLRGQPLSR